MLFRHWEVQQFLMWVSSNVFFIAKCFNYRPCSHDTGTRWKCKEIVMDCVFDIRNCRAAKSGSKALGQNAPPFPPPPLVALRTSIGERVLTIKVARSISTNTLGFYSHLKSWSLLICEILITVLDPYCRSYMQ